MLRGRSATPVEEMVSDSNHHMGRDCKGNSDVAEPIHAANRSSKKVAQPESLPTCSESHEEVAFVAESVGRGGKDQGEEVEPMHAGNHSNENAAGRDMPLGGNFSQRLLRLGQTRTRPSSPKVRIATRTTRSTTL